MTNIIYPNVWKVKVYKEDRFRNDFGKIKKRYTQIHNLGISETEDESYINGYRKAIKDIKFLNK